VVIALSLPVRVLTGLLVTALQAPSAWYTPVLVEWLRSDSAGATIAHNKQRRKSQVLLKRTVDHLAEVTGAVVGGAAKAGMRRMSRAMTSAQKRAMVAVSPLTEWMGIKVTDFDEGIAPQPFKQMYMVPLEVKFARKRIISQMDQAQSLTRMESGTTALRTWRDSEDGDGGGPRAAGRRKNLLSMDITKGVASAVFEGLHTACVRYIRNTKRISRHFYNDWGLAQPRDKDDKTLIWHQRSFIINRIDQAIKLSSEVKMEYRNYPDEALGMELMRLFMMDVLGRDTPVAALFDRHTRRTIFRKWVVVSAEAQAVLLLLLLGTMGWLVAATISMGRTKGEQWQQHWVALCFFNIFILFFIQMTLEAVVVFYIVPNVITPSLQRVQYRLRKAAEVLDEELQRDPKEREAQAVGMTEFSASDYLFTSTRLCREFPTLPESLLVLQFHEVMPMGLGVRDPKIEQQMGLEPGTLETRSRRSIRMAHFDGAVESSRTGSGDQHSDGDALPLGAMATRRTSDSSVSSAMSGTTDGSGSAYDSDDDSDLEEGEAEDFMDEMVIIASKLQRACRGSACRE
jgi:hypothetical protein